MSARSLYLKGGVVCLEAPEPEKVDVIVRGGRVVMSVPAGEPEDDSDVFDASGCVVTPGLVDIHAHVFDGLGGSVAADPFCIPHGVTTVVDGGSAGAATINAFRTITGPARTNILAWLNISTVGQVDSKIGELQFLPYVDVARAVTAARENSDIVVGFKARLSTYVAGGTCLPALRLLRQAGDAADLPSMVHIGDTNETLPEILEYLRPGDVVTHAFTGRRGGILDSSDRVHPAVREAQSRGILFDGGRGLGHLDFRVLRTAFEQGFLPDTLSTDMSRALPNEDARSLPAFGSMLLDLGLSISDVAALMCRHPARAIRRPELGAVRNGSPADLAVLKVEDRPLTVTDSGGRNWRLARRIKVVLAARAGQVVEPAHEGKVES